MSGRRVRIVCFVPISRNGKGARRYRSSQVAKPEVRARLGITPKPVMTPTLMGMFMFGNLLRESGVVSRLTNTAGGPLMDMVTIFLGLSVGASMQAETFLSFRPPRYRG